MICPKCKNQLPDGVKFCKYCGTQFAQSNVQRPAQQRPVQPNLQKPAPEKKKTSKGLIIAIVSVLLVGAIVLGILFIPDLINKDKDGSDSDKKTSSQSAEVTDNNKAPDKPAVTPDTTTPKPSNDFGIVSVGDYIKFGSYEQDNNTSNGKEDIEWRVLDKQDGKVLVISKYALDFKSYNVDYTDITWETCTLRAWLNNGFINEAFSSAEQSKILTTTVSADKNPDYDTDPGNATQDKVFLLSINEAERYFSSPDEMQCEPTDYAVANSAYEGYNGYCWWWLRSPGNFQDYAADVLIGGGVNGRGISVNYDFGAVRPVLWIAL